MPLAMTTAVSHHAEMWMADAMRPHGAVGDAMAAAAAAAAAKLSGRDDSERGAREGSDTGARAKTYRR